MNIQEIPVVREETASAVSFRPKLWQIPRPISAVYQRLPEKTAALRRRLLEIYRRHSRVKLDSSLAVEDMLITDLLAQQGLRVEVFMLQTGRLNAETLDLADEVRRRYPALDFRLYYPEEKAVEEYVQTHGLNAFYDSVELRKRCCHIRKVEPLNRALKNAPAWLTGQRAVGNPQRTYPGRTRQRARHRQIQPDFRLERTGSVGLHPAAAPALQRTLPPRPPQHRLRTLHHAREGRRRHPLRPLVVGKPRQQRMRPAQIAAATQKAT